MNLSKEITIKQAQEEVREFLDRQGEDWARVGNRFYLFTHMTEELGELARHIITAEFSLNLDRTAREPTPRERAISLIEDDLGDILYHILKFAVAYNIDLAETFGKTMSEIKKRYGKKATRRTRHARI